MIKWLQSVFLVKNVITPGSHVGGGEGGGGGGRVGLFALCGKS